MSFYGNNNGGQQSGFGDGGGQAAGGGGFFSPGANGAEGGVSSTPDFGGSQGGKGGNKREQETLVPVTIHMIKQAEQDANDENIFSFNGCQFTQVRLVGCIVEAKEQSTSLVYVVEDGTGRVEVKFWLDNDDTDDLASTRAKCSEGVYIRIIGQVRTFKDKRNITAYNIRPVEDFNEVTHHSLEAVLVNMRATKISSGGSATKPVATNNSAGQQQQQFNAGGGGGSDMSTINQDVLDIFKNGVKGQDYDTDQGLDIKTAIQHLVTKGYNAGDIRKACGFLQDEGHLYSTIDEDHLKSTEC